MVWIDGEYFDEPEIPGRSWVEELSDIIGRLFLEGIPIPPPPGVSSEVVLPTELREV